MATTASILVSFGGDENQLLEAALDGPRNGNRTTFGQGESVYFRVYHTIDYTVTPSSGTCSLEVSNESEDLVGEILSFIGNAVATVSKYITALTSQSWFDHDSGNNYGTLSIVGPKSIKAETADTDSVGVAIVNYTSAYDVWKLTPPINAPVDYHIGVHVKGDTA